MTRNFRGTKFLQFSQICLRPRKFYPERKPYPFPLKPFESLASVCAMAMYCYFSTVDKLPKLPDPTGSLPTKVPSLSIVLANAGVKNVLEESVGEGQEAVSNCRRMSMTVYNNRALFDMAAPRQWLHPRYIWYPRTIRYTRSPITRVMCVWLAYTQCGHGFAVEPQKIFHKIFASSQSMKSLAHENLTQTGVDNGRR